MVSPRPHGRSQAPETLKAWLRFWVQLMHSHSSLCSSLETLANTFVSFSKISISRERGRERDASAQPGPADCKKPNATDQQINACVDYTKQDQRNSSNGMMSETEQPDGPTQSFTNWMYRMPTCATHTYFLGGR